MRVCNAALAAVVVVNIVATGAVGKHISVNEVAAVLPAVSEVCSVRATAIVIVTVVVDFFVSIAAAVSVFFCTTERALWQ